MIKTYLSTSGLSRFAISENTIQSHIDSLKQTVTNAMMGSYVNESAAEMYRYAVPKLGEGGACSIFDEFEDEPYDLAKILNGSTPTHDYFLLRLNALIQTTQQLCGAGWIGIYQARKNIAGENVLVKLAYRGKPSRAEFPLTKEFAEGSTNSQVGLSGKAVVIDDVAAWQAKGQAFYVCDPAVQSEACVPVFSSDGKIIGIIDAEAQPLAHFNPQNLAPIVAAALVAEALLSGA